MNSASTVRVMGSGNRKTDDIGNFGGIKAKGVAVHLARFARKVTVESGQEKEKSVERRRVNAGLRAGSVQKPETARGVSRLPPGRSFLGTPKARANASRQRLVHLLDVGIPLLRVPA